MIALGISSTCCGLDWSFGAGVFSTISTFSISSATGSTFFSGGAFLPKSKASSCFNLSRAATFFAATNLI